MNRIPFLLIGLGLFLASGAPVFAQPTLSIPEPLPVNLGWRKWSATAEGGWAFSTQVTRRESSLPKGAHLHLDGASTTGHSTGATILVLPVKTLNRASVLPTHVGSHRPRFIPAKAKARVPFAAETASVAVSYCDDTGHLAAGLK